MKIYRNPGSPLTQRTFYGCFVLAWRDAKGRTPWVATFFSYLKHHLHLWKMFYKWDHPFFSRPALWLQKRKSDKAKESIDRII